VLKTRRFCQYVLFPIVIVGWFWFAWVLWLDEKSSLNINYKNNDSTLEPLSIDSMNQAVEELPPLVIQPIRNLLYAASKDVNVNNELLVHIAVEYTKRRPLDVDGWLWASLFSQRIDNTSEAKRYLKVAHQLAKRNTPKLNQVFTRYLELGLVDNALPVARDISYANPRKFRRLFYLLSRLKPDYNSVVQQVIPDSVLTHRGYDPNFYYKWALSDAIRAKNAKLARVVWSAVPDQIKSTPSFGLEYLKYLAILQKSADFISASEDISSDEYAVGEIINPSFESGLIGDQPCWQIRESSSVSWSQDDKGYNDDSGLLLEFNGIENVNYAHVSCLIAVEGGVSYRLSGYWSGADITTLSGLYIDVYSPGVKGVYSRIKSKVGSWPWEPFVMEFDVPDTIEMLSLRIRRNKTDFLDSKISGRVWFDAFKLQKVE